MPLLFGPKNLFELSDTERAAAYGEARRARARAIVDASKAAAAPYMSAENGERFFDDLKDDLYLYAGERGLYEAQRQAFYRSERESLFKGG